MTLDLTQAQRELLAKVLASYLSNLRAGIAATKRDTASMHAEGPLIDELQASPLRSRSLACRGGGENVHTTAASNQDG